jgi:hypothetical protein
MTVMEMMKLRDYAKQLGYVIVEDYSQVGMYTITFPNAYNEYMSVVDCSWEDLKNISFTTLTIDEIMNGEYVEPVEDITFPLCRVSYNEVKDFMDFYWGEYKQYLQQQKINKIMDYFN